MLSVKSSIFKTPHGHVTSVRELSHWRREFESSERKNQGKFEDYILRSEKEISGTSVH